MQWLPFVGGFCTRSLYACSFTYGDQENWLFSQYICLQDAKELFIDVEYRFAACINNPNCHNDYIDPFRYDVSGPVSRDELTDVDNYKWLNGTEENSVWYIPEGEDINRLYRTTLKMLRPDPEKSGFYLGLREPGTCAQVGRIIMYYNVCLAKQVGLVMYPEFAVPPKSGPKEEFLAQCVCNAHNVTSLSITSFSENSTCVDKAPGGAVCECDAGYELDGLSCKRT